MSRISEFDDRPVEDFPQLVEIVGAAVLIVEIVGVFPDVESKQRLEILRHRVGSVAALGDEKFP